MSVSTCIHDFSAGEAISLRNDVVSKFPKSHGNDREEGFMSLALRLADEGGSSRVRRNNISRKKHPRRHVRRRARQTRLCSASHARNTAFGGQPNVKVRTLGPKDVDEEKLNMQTRLLKQHKHYSIPRKSNGSENRSDNREAENDSCTNLTEVFQDLKPILGCDPDVEANIAKETLKLMRKELQKVRAMVTKETNTMRRYFGNRRNSGSKSLTNLAGGMSDKESTERDASTNLCCRSDLGLTDNTNQSTSGGVGAPDKKFSMLIAYMSKSWDSRTFPHRKLCVDSNRNARKYVPSECNRWEPDGRLRDTLNKDNNNSYVRQRTRLGASMKPAETPTIPLPCCGGYLGQGLYSSLMCTGSKFGVSNMGARATLASLPRMKNCSGSSPTESRDKVGNSSFGGSRRNQTRIFLNGLGQGQNLRQSSVGCRSNNAAPLCALHLTKPAF